MLCSKKSAANANEVGENSEARVLLLDLGSLERPRREVLFADGPVQGEPAYRSSATRLMPTYNNRRSSPTSQHHHYFSH